MAPNPKTGANEMRCHDCEIALVRETRPTEYAYKGHSTTVDQPAWWCPSCDEAVLVGSDTRAPDLAIATLRAKVDGVLSPADVQRIRVRIGLSQRRAGAILGGGPHAFQKYEKGEVGVSQAMSNLLRLLDHDPSLLIRLEPKRVA